MTTLRRCTEATLPARRHDPVDAATVTAATEIVSDVRARGTVAAREHGLRLGDLAADAPLLYDGGELRRAKEAAPYEVREVLDRTAERIGAFAARQRAALGTIDIEIAGGRAGHDIVPMERAGCYAPGGRFPLLSSVLMTSTVARAAGVADIVVASPRPSIAMLAAAEIAGASSLLALGGAQAIAALAYGIDGVQARDIVVGPGNRWVTAAKRVVAGDVGIDMLAGPSELVVVADRTADPELVAADLLAQAEHDPDAFPALVALEEGVVTNVERALASQLATLPTATNARAALENGFAVVVDDIESAARVCNRLAPEHLELMVAEVSASTPLFRECGAMFVGPHAAEVFGDYGLGPNHVLPTGGAARRTAGLSVFTFLRIRTWIAAHAPLAGEVVADAAALARMEGLEAHARAAERRRG